MADLCLGVTNPPENIENWETPLPVPRVTYQDYAEIVTAASGKSIGRGLPVCEWRFSRLNSAQRAALRVICPGASASVFLRTLTNDDTYETFSAIMHWPPEEMREPAIRDRLDFVIRFTFLTAV